MAIILIQIKQWKEEVNTVRHKHTLEAELFAQLLDNAEMFCLIWTPIWCTFVQLDTLAEIDVVVYVWLHKGV